ncbi:MAG TPA: lytic murein transglycosylase, partial [Burkholderiaceae bacterium]|nr:lytic murein transglycosylase [Burkholderiaceae bacterium]
MSLVSSRPPWPPRIYALPAVLLAGLLATACAVPTEARVPAKAAKPAPPAKPAAAETPAYGAREDVLAFARDVAQRQPQLDPEWIRQTLEQARYIPDVARLIMPPAENATGTARSWTAYRARAVDTARVRGGVDFWNENQRWLDAAQKRYGVPPEIVVGILGVETLFGRQTGGFRVLDALATLSFSFPPGRRDRSEYFRSELEQLLVLAQRDKADLLTLKGSYAGALGWPQFMPSSWLKYAVDFDGDGHVDLHNSVPDVIGSIANYLATFGWREGMPTHYAVVPPNEPAQRTVLLAPD